MLNFSRDEQNQYLSRYHVLKTFSFDHSKWDLVQFNGKDFSNNDQRLALLIIYKQERFFKANLNLLSFLNTGLCLNSIHHLQKDSNYSIFFNIIQENFISEKLNKIRGLSELRQIGLFIKILDKIIEINEKGYYFKFLEQEEIFLVRNRCSDSIDLDDSDVRIFLKPENFYEPLESDKKIEKKWKKKQNKLVGNILFTLATGKSLTNYMKLEEKFIDISETLLKFGHTLQYSKLFLEFFYKGTFRTLTEISDAFALVAFNRKLNFNDSVKINEFRKKGNFMPTTNNLRIITETLSQNLKLKFIFSSNRLKFRKTPYEKSINQSRFLSLPDYPLNNSLNSTKNAKKFLNCSQNSEDSLVNSYEKSTEFSSITPKNETLNDRDGSINVANESFTSNSTKREGNNAFLSVSNRESFNNESKKPSNIATQGSISLKNGTKKKCGRCGEFNPDTRLKCNHYIHKLCLEQIMNDKKNSLNFFCTICFKPINVKELNNSKN